MPTKAGQYLASFKKELIGKLPLPAKALVWANEKIIGPAYMNIMTQKAEQSIPQMRDRFIAVTEGKFDYTHPKPIKNDLMKDVKIDWKKVGNFVLSMASNAQKNAMQSPPQLPYGYNAQGNYNSQPMSNVSGTTPDAPTGKTSDSWDKNPLVLIGGLALLAMLLTKK
jgi:hypothetical protein